ncbi:hypothetical protein [Candidatus Planktophila versatilis]|uniref:hypothetical protein n=1 Tax=Candidatus Planktophila versatilis TaxID=1884905 RepID=UPI000BAC6D68|nr:hypothetical protein [Candidatus Planktophila versatilis]ASY26179.1 hypothetical protein A1sIIB142_01970 [Candidatus Planktophila versatilis]
MKKNLPVLLALTFLISSSSPVQAAGGLDGFVVIPGFTEISYPTKVTIGTSGCKTIKFSYVNDEDLVQENSAFLIQILHKTKKQSHGFGAWFSTLTANPNSIELGPMPRAGLISVKICKKKWTIGSGTSKALAAATPPGAYRIYFTAGYVDSITGEPLEGKIEIFKDLKVS